MIKWIFLSVVVVIVITIIIYAISTKKISLPEKEENVTSVTTSNSSNEMTPKLNLPGEIKPALNLPTSITIDETSNMNHTIPTVNPESNENDPTVSYISAPTINEIISQIPPAPTVNDIISQIPPTPTVNEIIAQMPPIPTVNEIIAQLPPIPTVDDVIAKMPPYPVIPTIPSITDNLKSAYPVGSIYLTTSSSNPSVLLGFGSWSRIESNKYLMTYTSGGSTGGSNYISVANMPSHTHKFMNKIRKRGGRATNDCSGGCDWVDDTVKRNNTDFDEIDNTTYSSGSGSAYYPSYYTVAAWRRIA